MTLHDQYQTLLKRGMPKHPRLAWCPDEDGDGNCYWFWVLGDKEFVDESDARDLITMHALRWWLGLKCIDPTTVAFGSEKCGTPIYKVSRDDCLSREVTITSFAERDNGWKHSGPVYVGTDVYESEHHNPCTRYRSHDLNDDETKYGVNEVSGAVLSTILAATEHLSPPAKG